MWPLQERFHRGPISQVPREWFETVARILNHLQGVNLTVKKTAAPSAENPWQLIGPEVEEGSALISHGETHETGGTDEISVAGLFGQLADRQDASKLQGRTVADAAPADQQALVWNSAAAQWEPTALPGGDSAKLDDLQPPDDNTDLNATTLAHGLLPKLPGDSSLFLDGAGSWSSPVYAHNHDGVYLRIDSAPWIGGTPWVSWSEVFYGASSSERLATITAAGSTQLRTYTGTLGSFLPAGATGGILYHNGTTWTPLAVGSTGQVLQVTAGVPAWAAAPATLLVAGSQEMQIPMWEAAQGKYTPELITADWIYYWLTGEGTSGHVLTSGGAGEPAFQSLSAVLTTAFGTPATSQVLVGKKYTGGAMGWDYLRAT